MGYWPELYYIHSKHKKSPKEKATTTTTTTTRFTVNLVKIHEKKKRRDLPIAKELSKTHNLVFFFFFWFYFVASIETMASISWNVCVICFSSL